MQNVLRARDENCRVLTGLDYLNREIAIPSRRSRPTSLSRAMERTQDHLARSAGLHAREEHTTHAALDGRHQFARADQRHQDCHHTGSCARGILPAAPAVIMSSRIRVDRDDVPLFGRGPER
jgi:hypothetical protein